MIDRRREPRLDSDLTVLIWGIDAQGLAFAQRALVRNISGQGALLSGVNQLLRCGDPIVIQYHQQRARFRVVWTRDSGNGHKIQAAVHQFEAEECPWRDELCTETTASRPETQPNQPTA